MAWVDAARSSAFLETTGLGVEDAIAVVVGGVG